MLLRYFLTLLSIAALANGSNCVGPGSFCGALKPGMVAFIGTPLQVSFDQYRTAIVTFHIVEKLVGLRDAKTVTIVFGDGYLESSEARLFVVTPSEKGLYLHNGCGAGFDLPLNIPETKLFRANVSKRAPAELTVNVRSYPGFVDIPNLRMQLRGNGRFYEAVSGTSSTLNFGTIPSGEYEMTLSRKNFSPVSPLGPLTILPGSCAMARAYLQPSSNVSGQLIDSNGSPIAQARLLLRGAPKDLALFNLYDAALSLVQSLFRRPEQKNVLLDTKTTSSGSFQFSGVDPGWYRLAMPDKENELGRYDRHTETYYPGVPSWRSASVIFVEEGQSVHGLKFRLPN
jgi:hypothetical protein